MTRSEALLEAGDGATAVAGRSVFLPPVGVFLPPVAKKHSPLGCINSGYSLGAPQPVQGKVFFATEKVLPPVAKNIFISLHTMLPSIVFRLCNIPLVRCLRI